MLYDDLVGNRVSIPPSHQVILGRAGDIRLGADDPAMHRHFLQLWNQQGAWYIRNVGSFITTRIISRGQNRFAPQRLSPRTTLPLPPGEVGITFDTKHMAYEIALFNAAPPPRYAVTPVPDVPFTAEGFEPNAEQLQLLRALAEPLWRDPAAEPHLVWPARSKRSASGVAPNTALTSRRGGIYFPWRARRSATDRAWSPRSSRRRPERCSGRSTFVATPSPSLIRPRIMCSVPM